MYYDDFFIGQEFQIDGVLIEKEKMLSFAKEYDSIPIHLDEQYAKNSRFRDLIAPGLMTFMSVWNKFVESGIFETHLIAGKTFQVEWFFPVYAGDVLSGKVVITNLITRNPYNGIVEFKLTIFNQNEKLVMDTTTEIIVARSPASLEPQKTR
ncbi:MAG: FAS1-like dehydratase domain-containing protein [Syntrophomonadaceae bacterium]|jgi:3-hydroxybutyryl-CoA dehydratase